MKIAVSGCAGYLGSVLVGELLAAGHQVTGVDDLIYDNGFAITPYLGHWNFYFKKLDVCSRADWVHGHDAVIHLAALVGAPICDKCPDYYVRQANVYSVKMVVEQLSKKQKLVYATTNSGYGKTSGSACDEASPLNPVSLYGRTKCEGERHALNHQNAVSLRLATVFGVSVRMRFDLMVNDFVAKLYQLRNVAKYSDEYTPKFTIYEPHYRRNFVHIRDVVRAIMFAIDEDLTGVYNVGLDAANMTKLELAHAIEQELDIKRSFVKIGEGTDPDQRDYVVSNEKLAKTGFRFRHSLTEGIREVAQACSFFTPERIARMTNVANA